VNERIRRIALAGLIATHLALVLSVLSQPFFVSAYAPEFRAITWSIHHDTVHRRGPAADFFSVYEAGLRAAHGTHLYEDRDVPGATPYHYPYRYSPLVAHTLGRVVTFFSPRRAWQLWSLVLEGLLATTVLTLRRRAREHWVGDAVSAVLLLSTPFLLEVHIGQFTFATLALTALALLVVDEGEGTFRGAERYALAVGLKTFPLVAAPALLRSPAGRRALAVTALTLVPVVVWFAMHPGTWAAFTAANFGGVTLLGMDAGNHGFAYVIYLAGRDLSGPWSAESWASTWRVMQLVALAATSLVVLRSRSTSAVLGGAALVMAYQLTYTHVWEHHMSGTLALASAAVITASTPHGDAPARWSARETIAAVVMLVLLAAPTPFVWLDVALDPRVFDPSYAWEPWMRYMLPLSKALPLLVLYALIVKTLVRREAR
jgi:hypothetical protein